MIESAQLTVASDLTAEESFSRLLALNESRIFAFIFTLVHDRDASREVLQEVSIVLWRKFESFDPSTSFAVWAMSVARLSVMEWRRKQKHLPLLLDNETLALLACDAIAVSLEADARSAALHNCLDDLSECDRKLIASRHDAEHTIVAIAQEMKLSRVSVYKKLNGLYSMLLDCINQRIARENGASL